MGYVAKASARRANRHNSRAIERRDHGSDMYTQAQPSDSRLASFHNPTDKLGSARPVTATSDRNCGSGNATNRLQRAECATVAGAYLLSLIRHARSLWWTIDRHATSRHHRCLTEHDRGRVSMVIPQAHTGALPRPCMYVHASLHLKHPWHCQGASCNVHACRRQLR